MRTIKFRAWDGVKFDYTPTIWNGMVWNPVRDREEDGSIIQQFTGLLDRNKKEIYEGDIVRYEDTDYHTGSRRMKPQTIFTNHEVFFDDEMLEFGMKYNNGLFHCQFYNNFEVIGNIYENPELL